MSAGCQQYMVRLVDPKRQAFTIVCEQCGYELPIGALNLIDVDAVGRVMLQHAEGSLRKFSPRESCPMCDSGHFCIDHCHGNTLG